MIATIQREWSRVEGWYMNQPEATERPWRAMNNAERLAAREAYRAWRAAIHEETLDLITGGRRPRPNDEY